MARSHIILVACAASKRAVPCRAEDLYISPLFGTAKRFAQDRADAWYILSALHGVIAPDSIIETYERTLNEMAIAERRTWATRVNDRLVELLPFESQVTILAGKKYRQFVEPFLRDRGFEVHVPLASMGIGKQLQWLQRMNAAHGGEGPSEE